MQNKTSDSSIKLIIKSALCKYLVSLYEHLTFKVPHKDM